MDTYRHYRSPIYYERFTQLTLNARKSRTVRRNNMLQWLLGVGGRKVRLVRSRPRSSDDVGSRLPTHKLWTPKGILQAVKDRELGIQDKCVGIAEMVAAIENGRRAFPPHDFILHLTELTYAIQNAGALSTTHVMESTFERVAPQPSTLSHDIVADRAGVRDRLASLADRRLIRMHKH